MSLFLGPFGIIAAGVAVMLESWVFVNIFVGSFLIKGMIGEEIFEAVNPRSIPVAEIGPSTTFQGVHPRLETQTWCQSRHRRSRYTRRTILSTWGNHSVFAYFTSRIHSIYWMGIVRLYQCGKDRQILCSSVFEKRERFDDERIEESGG